MPQDFGIFFGDEFLGTSTPKQGIKHIINPKRFSGNVDFKDQVIVNQSLNSCTSELKCSYTKPEAKKPRAIGDSASNLNTSWFLPIDHVVSADWPRGLLRPGHVFIMPYLLSSTAFHIRNIFFFDMWKVPGDYGKLSHAFWY